MPSFDELRATSYHAGEGDTVGRCCCQPQLFATRSMRLVTADTRSNALCKAQCCHLKLALHVRFTCLPSVDRPVTKPQPTRLPVRDCLLLHKAFPLPCSLPPLLSYIPPPTTPEPFLCNQVKHTTALTLSNIQPTHHTRPPSKPSTCLTPTVRISTTVRSLFPNTSMPPLTSLAEVADHVTPEHSKSTTEKISDTVTGVGDKIQRYASLTTSSPSTPST